MERFDDFLIKFSKKNINYEKLFEDIIITVFNFELKSYSERIEIELKNIESKKKLLSHDAETYQSINYYILNYERFFNRELIVINKLIENVRYLEYEKIKVFKKYNSLNDFVEDVVKSLDNIKSYIDTIKIPTDLAEPLPKELEKAIVISNFNRDINNLFFSCRTTINSVQQARLKLKNLVDYIIKKLRKIDPADSRLNALKDSYKEELRLLIISEYEKYRGIRIDALLLLSPIDYPQTAFRLRSLQLKIGYDAFSKFTDIFLFLFYREFARGLAEKTLPEKNIPVGSRFYFRKDAKIKAVKDSYEKDTMFKSIMRRLKLIAGEDPVQISALKMWDKEAFRHALIAPSQFHYLEILKQLYPEVIPEIKSIPKFCIFGALDEKLNMAKRREEVIATFELLGNIKIVILENTKHDLDSGGYKNNLYWNPVFAKYVYDFFLLLAQA